MPLPADTDASTPRHLRDKYAIVGVGETTYTRGSGRTTRALGSWAVRNAMLDAGLKPTDIIKRPVALTEKATRLKEANKVIFEVALSANKLEIKSAVETLFNVKVKAVNTQVRKGKLKTFKNIRALQSDVKRAVVTLEEGHSIDVTTGL